MIRLIPFDYFEIPTELNSKQIRERLMLVTKRSWEKKNFRTGIVFSGDIGLDEFQIKKCLSYRNSFQPVVYGKICKTEHGCVLKIKQRPGNFVRKFIYIWFLVCGLFCLISIRMLANGDAGFFIPCCMMGLGAFLIIHIAFWVEARHTKDILEKTLNINS